MPQQSRSVGATTYSPWSDENSGYKFASQFKAVTFYDSPLTGAIGSTAKPILVTGLSITSISGGGYNLLFQEGDNQPNGFSGLEATTADATCYYGFQHTDNNRINFKRGDGVNPNGIWGNGTNPPPGSVGASPSWSAVSIAGTITWSHVPTAPTITSATISESNASVTLYFSAPSDNGGKAVNGYRVLYKVQNTATDGTASSWTVLTTGSTNGPNIAKGVVAASPAVISGLVPGAKYDFRVAALNEVTHEHNGGTASVVGTYTSPTAHTGTNASRNSVTLAGAPVFIFDNMPTFEVFGQTYAGVAEARFPTPELSGLDFTYEVLTTGFTVPSGYTAGRPAGTTLTSVEGGAILAGVLTDTTAKTYIFTIKATEASTGATVTSDPFIVRVQNSRLQSRDSGTFARRTTKVRVGTSWLVAGVRVYDSTYTSPYDGSHWRPLE